MDTAEAPMAPHAPAQERTQRDQRWVLVAAAVLAVIAVLVAGYLAAVGVRAQIDAHLRAGGAGANSGLLEIEAEQLSLLRELTFTKGVGAALAAKNSVELNRLVTPLQANSEVPMVDVVLPGGVVILAVRSRGAPRPVAVRRHLPAIRQAISTADGIRGGRFTEIVTLQRAPTLLTIGPALVGSQPVGAVLVMTPLSDVLARLATQVGSTLTAYNASGYPVATTSASTPPALTPSQARSTLHGAPVWVRETAGSTREMIGRLVVEHQAEEALGVSVHDDSFRTEFLVDVSGLVGLLLAGLLLDDYSRRRAPLRESARSRSTQ